MAIAARDAAIIFHLCALEISFRSFTRSLVDMTFPISTFERVWAETSRDLAKQLAQIDSIMLIAATAVRRTGCCAFSGGMETHGSGRWRPGIAAPSGAIGPAEGDQRDRGVAVCLSGCNEC